MWQASDRSGVFIVKRSGRAMDVNVRAAAPLVLRSLLTEERMRSFVAARADLEDALELYEWNMRASSSMTELTGMVEVVTRNDHLRFLALPGRIEVPDHALDPSTPPSVPPRSPGPAHTAARGQTALPTAALRAEPRGPPRTDPRSRPRPRPPAGHRAAAVGLPGRRQLGEPGVRPPRGPRCEALAQDRAADTAPRNCAVRCPQRGFVDA